MNFFHTAALTMLIAATFVSATSAQDDGILLSDSFEDGKNAPDGWKQGANIPGVRYVYDKRQAKTGKRSLSLRKSAQRYFPIAQWFRVLPVSNDLPAVKVTVQVRAEKATKAIVDVMFLDAADKPQGHEWAAYIGAKEATDPPADHDWKEYSATVNVPAGTKQLVVGLQIYGPGTIWFDDLEVRVAGEAEDTPEAGGSPETIEVKIGDETGRYLFIAPRDETAPADGNALLVVLPGGDGSADFHPFVRRIHEQALSGDFALAQPVARKWTDDQVIIWPTQATRSDAVKCTTEELVEAVVAHAGETTELDPSRIFLLAWSSGGPAAFAVLLQEKSPAAGGLIAMSVFKPQQLPSPMNAKGRSIYLLHSPQDRTCPYRMAESARDVLSKAGVRTTLVDYAGGHGWQGDVFGNIRNGITWLDEPR